MPQIDIAEEVIYVEIVDEQIDLNIKNATTILKNGSKIGAVRAINFIEGDNVTLEIEQVGNQINVTVNSSGSGGGGGTVDHWRGAHAIANAYPAAGTGSGTLGAIEAGDQWYLSVASTLNGDLWNAGTTLIALIDVPGSTNSNWLIKA
jgi:hypothetical protein